MYGPFTCARREIKRLVEQHGGAVILSHGALFDALRQADERLANCSDSTLEQAALRTTWLETRQARQDGKILLYGRDLKEAEARRVASRL